MTRLVSKVIAALRQLESVQVTLWMGSGGIAMITGNLVLAGLLSTSDFGLLLLFQAVLVAGVAVSPLGLDGLIVRGEVALGRWVVVRTALAATAVALLAGSFLLVVFGFPWWTLLYLVSGCVGGSCARLYAADRQASVQLNSSQLISQIPSFTYASAVLLLVTDWTLSWWSGAALLVLGQTAAVIVGIWGKHHGLGVGGNEGSLSSAGPQVWPKALALAAVLASLLALNYLERFVTAGLLGLEAVALLGVASTVVSSPYRLFGAGIQYALTPRLRLAGSVSARYRTVVSEMVLAIPTSAVGGAVLLTVARPVVNTLYGEKYAVSLEIALALVIVGVVRVIYGHGAAVVTALGNSLELRWFSIAGWVGALVAGLASTSLARFGLVGVIYGVGFGWVVRTGAAYWLGARAIGRVA